MKVLHVGCGPQNHLKLNPLFREADWSEVRLDIDPSVSPDIIASIVDMRSINSESFDAVWSSHNLEHLYLDEVPVALKEFYRVLRPGGFLLAVVPDLQEIAKFVVADQLDREISIVVGEGSDGKNLPLTPYHYIYGGPGYMAHRTGFTARILAEFIQKTGFSQTRIAKRPFEIWAAASKAGEVPKSVLDQAMCRVPRN